MKRSTYLIIFCFLASLLCIISHTIQQYFPLLPERNELAPDLLEKKPYNCDPAIEKDVTLNHISSAERESFDRKNAFFEDEENRSDKAKETANSNLSQKKSTEPKQSALKDKFPSAPPDLQTKADNVHFVLTGQHQHNAFIEIIMIVSLVPKRCAHLTMINPSKKVAFKKQLCPIGALLTRGADRNQFNRITAELSGLEPQFYIDLNLEGFIEIINLLHDWAGSTASSPESSNLNGSAGENMLSLLSNFQAQSIEKENRLIDYLLLASDVRADHLGLKLLWIGYRNLTTNLSLKELIRLRKVSEKISPLKISLTEID